MAGSSETRRGPRAPAIDVPAAWVGFLRAHSAITRQMDADLIAAHQLTLNDYEVLLHLSRAPDRRMRRVDLANRVVLTQSGITRLLGGLEQAGFVERASCPTDGRVVYAQLTAAGHAKLRAASATHLDGIRRLFSSRFAADELKVLESLLGRLPVARGDADCGPS
jgi:DNA-binding MarR family transcriptional regulator